MLWLQKCSAPPKVSFILNLVPVVEVSPKLPGPLGKFQLQQWKHRQTFDCVSTAVIFGSGQVVYGWIF